MAFAWFPPVGGLVSEIFFLWLERVVLTVCFLLFSATNFLLLFLYLTFIVDLFVVSVYGVAVGDLRGHWFDLHGNKA